MKKKILLTRPRASSEKWAELLAKRGFETVLDPLLTILPTHAACPEGSFHAVCITSANVFDALKVSAPACENLLRLPCFCVGPSTGAAARAFGFTDIRIGPNDGAALAHMAAISLSDVARSVLYIAGEIVDEKARDILSQCHVTVTSWIVYRAAAAEDLAAATKDLLTKHMIAAVLVFSSRSARILVSLIEKNDLSSNCCSIAAVGLSQSVADVLQRLPWRLHVAASSDEEDILACLEIAMTQSDPASFPKTMSAPVRKEKGVFGRILVLLFLAFICGIVAMRLPLLHAFRSSAEGRGVSELASLAQRVDILETHVHALTEIPATSPAGTDVATLAGTVKDLETEVADLKAQTKASTSPLAVQRLVATSFAFWELQEAARMGLPYLGPLAQLKLATEADSTASELVAAIEPFADTPPPTLVQLRASLAEQQLPDDTAVTNQASLEARFVKLMRPVFSVRPLHDPQCGALSKALEDGSAVKAVDAFGQLTVTTQQALSRWHDGLIARATLDVAIEKLATHFTIPHAADAP